MIPLTQSKVAGFTPRWARFAGFSALFDAPTSADFYGGLEATLTQLDADLLLRQHLLCALPAASYHVTVWDGVNAGNLLSLPPARQPAWREFMSNLPHHAHEPPQELIELARADLLSLPFEPVSFAFDRLVIWGEAVLVACLKAADETSAVRLAAMTDRRSALDAGLRARLGVGADKIWVPHVSLGYFADPTGAKSAAPELARWNVNVAERLAATRLTFCSLSLYVFGDMSAFVRLPGGKQTG